VVAGHEVDLYWADAALAVEVDGAAYHARLATELASIRQGGLALGPRPHTR
jgi:hypothetical protein